MASELHEVVAEVLADAGDEHRAGKLGALVALADRQVDAAHVVEAAHALEAALLVEEVAELREVQVLLLGQVEDHACGAWFRAQIKPSSSSGGRSPCVDDEDDEEEEGTAATSMAPLPNPP